MKKIVALKGKSNSGKTSSFLILGRLMLEDGYYLKEGDFLERENRARRRDFVQIFEKNGKKIGLASEGDVYKVVRSRLDDLSATGCEIILCTCRSFDKKKPGTNEAVNETQGYEKEFVRKEREADTAKRDEANLESAIELLKKLNALIS